MPYSWYAYWNDSDGWCRNDQISGQCRQHRCFHGSTVEIILAENHHTVPVNFINRVIDPSGIYQSFHWQSGFSWYKSMEDRLIIHPRFNIPWQDKQDWNGIILIHLSHQNCFPMNCYLNYKKGWRNLQWNRPITIKNQMRIQRQMRIRHQRLKRFLTS